MATLKHINSKNADYGAAEQYLLFEHDEFTMKPVLDETGRLIPREDYRLSTLNCDGEDFAVACMRANLRYQKNQRREDVKSHHYIISFDPRDGPDNGLTVDRAQALGEQFCKEHFPGHQALVCTHPDGHNHSGNIHVHIVINSLRIEEVGTVIVKDMSRLGRNYLQVGFYTEMLFPQKGVRFIAVNDNVDSASEGMDNDFTPLRNLFNEWLVRDTSKKIKAVKKSKGMSGKPVTSKPVYGYVMDEDENFIIDEEAAPVVQQIYQLCLAGNGPTKIARMLTEQQIPTPGTLEYQRTGSTRRYHPGYECKWATNNVNGKISDERFMELSADYEAEQAELKKRAAALQAELDKSQAATVNAEKFMGIVRKHLAFEELTPTLLREMIEKIVVHECSYDENGTRRQDIEIYYSFVGKIDLPE